LANGRPIANIRLVSDLQFLKPGNSDQPASSTALKVLAVIAVVAALRLCESVLIPLALAVLLSFALSPAVKVLRRMRVRRAPAVLLVVMITLAALMGIGWFVTGQLLEVATELPAYRQNIHQKLQDLQGTARGRFGRLADNLAQMSDEFGSQFAPSASTNAVPVQVVVPTSTSFTSVRSFFGPLVVPLEDLGIVVIFAIFILFEREHLRDRLLRLVGLGQLGLTTKALDDAANGVSTYLQMQLIVNASSGLLFATGLALIGVPHALLWGVVLALFRFVPYVGVPAAAIMPILLTIVASQGWMRPLLTVALVLVLEVTISQIIEPWLYGGQTGISSLAILVAGVFWGFLWGPLGLILSTPLTVCLVVLGRHVPQLEALQIMLGDEPVLALEVRFYQRLLALDAGEAREIVARARKDRSLEEVYDDIIVPALSLAEHERYRTDARDVRMEYICQSTSQIVEELAQGASISIARHPEAGRILCVGASDFADRVTAAMLGQLLELRGWIALPLSSQALDLIAQPDDIICLCALPPLAVMHARTLAKQVRDRLPEVKIFVCLWGLPEAHVERAAAMLPEALITSMKGAIEEVGKQIASARVETADKTLS
jgi:predicted PurR-regulated permease PerM